MDQDQDLVEKMMVVVLADLGPCSVCTELGLEGPVAFVEDVQETRVKEAHEKVYRC